MPNKAEKIMMRATFVGVVIGAIIGVLTTEVDDITFLFWMMAGAIMGTFAGFACLIFCKDCPEKEVNNKEKKY